MATGGGGGGVQGVRTGNEKIIFKGNLDILTTDYQKQ